jgi:hypothetical protein
MVTSYLIFTKQEDINPSIKTSFIIEDPDSGKIPVVIFDRYLVGIVDGADNNEANNGVKTIIENLSK